MRQLKLPSGRRVILSDTVGFVSDLPHELVAAFRATLEEVLEADIIVHVRDIAHPESEAQLRDVENVLDQLGIDVHGEESPATRTFIEALNKMDLLDEVAAASVEAGVARTPGQVAISALTGAGMDVLLGLLDTALSARRRPLSIAVPLEDGETIAWLYRRGEVLTRTDGETEAHLKVLLDDADLARLRKRGVVLDRAAE